MVRKLLDIIFLSSFHVVLAAVGCAIMFYRMPDGNGSVKPLALVILAFCTWAIYIADRILDVQKPDYVASRRHDFFKKNKVISIISIGFLLIIGALLSFFLPQRIALFGVLISLGVIFYLFWVFKVLQTGQGSWFKELFTALIFTLAVTTVPLLDHPVITISQWLLVFMFFLLAYQNLLMFNFFESLEQKKERLSSQYFKACKLLGVIQIILFIIFFSAAWEYTNKVATAILIMSLLKNLIAIFPNTFLKHQRYRMLGDSIFLLSFLV